MQARPLKDDGCTVVDAPYKEEDLDASKLGVDTSFPVLRSPWLKVASDFVKAPVYSTFITPNSPWLVPLMFGPNISGTVGFGGPATVSSCSTGAYFWERNSESKTYISAWSTGQSIEYQLLRYLASKSNSLYADTTTVQPASLRLMPCIRT